MNLINICTQHLVAIGEALQAHEKDHGDFPDVGSRLRTRELIQATGAEILFLPPYSPDYNPIEHDFANIKRLREYNADISIDDVINMYPLL